MSLVFLLTWKGHQSTKLSMDVTQWSSEKEIGPNGPNKIKEGKHKLYKLTARNKGGFSPPNLFKLHCKKLR